MSVYGDYNPQNKSGTFMGVKTGGAAVRGVKTGGAAVTGVKTNKQSLPPPAKKDVPWAYKPPAPSLQAGYSRGWLPDMSQKAAPEPDTSFQFGMPAPNLADYIGNAQSNNMFASQISTIDARKADLEVRRQAAMAAISGGSEALAKSVGAGRDQVDARYTQGIQDQTAATTALQQKLAQSNANGRAQSASLYANLGVADPNAAQAGLAQESAIQGDLAAKAQSADTEQRARQLTQYGLGTTNVDASRARGVELQASSARDYGKSLADLLDQQASLKAQSQQQAISSGTAAYNAAQSTWQDARNFDYKQYSDNQNNAQQQAQFAIAQQGMNDRSSVLNAQAKQTPEDSIYNQLVQMGEDPNNIKQWLTDAYSNSNISANALTPSANNPLSTSALYSYLKKSGIAK